MKAKLPLIALLFVAGSFTHAAEQAQPYNPAAHQAPLSGAGLAALEHACKLVVAINVLDWKTVEAAIPGNNFVLDFHLKRVSKESKDWHGVGAYRGSDYQKEGQLLTHRFGYGPGRTHPHEIWFHYKIEGDKFTFQTISILGW